MKYFIPSSAIICIALCLILQQSVESRGIDGRIISGTPAALGQFPWQVIIKEDKDDKLKCGGSIITDTWVLTAGHCTYGLPSVYLLFGTIYLYDTTAVSMTATELIIHPDYNDENLNNDVSIIMLPKPLTFSATIQPIALVKPNSGSLIGTVGTIAGFGYTSDEELQFSKYLQWAQVEVIANEACEAIFGKDFIQPTNMCAQGYRDTKQSICSGDSGGPLIARDDAGNWRQIGINSFVAYEACTEGYPSGYVRLSSYTRFITQMTGIEV